MLEKFVRLFASTSLEEARDMSSKPKSSGNSWRDCLAFGAICLFLAVWLFSESHTVFDTDWFSESFVLESAQHYHRDGNKGSNVDELHLYSTDGRVYEVDSDSISLSEIKTVLAALESGMQIDVLLAKNGIRELVAGGEVLLSRETTQRHLRSDFRRSTVFAAIPFFLGVYAILRAVALSIKKRKGWKF